MIDLFFFFSGFFSLFLIFLSIYAIKIMYENRDKKITLQQSHPKVHYY